MSCFYVEKHIHHPWLPSTLEFGKSLCRTEDQTLASCSTSLGEVDQYDKVKGSHPEIEIWFSFCQKDPHHCSQ